MQSNRTRQLRRITRLLLGIAPVLACAISLRADTNELRYVEVQSLLGQVYDTAIAADDAETFGLTIPRGTALARRLFYPVKNLGVPMIQRLDRPQYKEMLLRRPNRSHTEYLNPNPETSEPTIPVSQPPPISVTTGAGDTHAIILSWPLSEGNWQLEVTPVLTGPDTAWFPVSPSSYATNAQTISCIQPLQPVGSRFFRIRKL